MRRFRLHSLAPLAVIAVCGLLLAGPLAAYTIILKDGKQIIAKEKYRIEKNGKAIIVLPNGTSTSIDAREIDVRRTEQANQSNYGTAVVLEPGNPRQNNPAPQAQTPQQKTLADLIKNRDAAPRDLPEVRRETPRSATADSSKTRAGFVDFSGAARKPYAHMEVVSDLQQFLRGQGIEDAEIYAGTDASRMLIEVTTNSEASVFRALTIGSNALLHIRDRHANRVSAFELLLTTPERERAGQFVLTPDMASDLVSKKVDVASFFIGHVQF
ncbi:MAG TPA: hypothetical protein VMW27_10995 [Thermoanaerobaculia bacterium]|nr:hypothetical protein [Thermoanaerobaculia bacterium]